MKKKNIVDKEKIFNLKHQYFITKILKLEGKIYIMINGLKRVQDL